MSLFYSSIIWRYVSERVTRNGTDIITSNRYLRETLFVSHRLDGCPSSDSYQLASLLKTSLETDKTILKLIQLLCKAEHLSAALDAVLLLTQPPSLEAAGKIAAFFRLPGLVDRIEIVKENKATIARREKEGGANAKRDEKWGHLMDSRTIVGVSSQVPYGIQQSSNVAFEKKRSLFESTAPSSSIGSASFLGQSTNSKGKRRSTGVMVESTTYADEDDDTGGAVAAEEDDLFGPLSEVDDSMQVDEDDNASEEGSERASKRRRGDSESNERVEAAIEEDYGEYEDDDVVVPVAVVSKKRELPDSFQTDYVECC